MVARLSRAPSGTTTRRSRTWARVFGLSTQGTGYQREAAERLHLPFGLLSDEKRVFAEALGLPTFEVEGMPLVQRLTLVVHEGRIETVFYPVFPPGDARKVTGWLRRGNA